MSRRVLAWSLALAGLTVGLGATLVRPPRPRLVWNASPSAPLGLYAVTAPARIRPGQTVIAWVPEPQRRLAAERRYVPLNVPLVKRVAAAAGDRVCASGADILVDGELVAVRRRFDPSGRPMPWWQGCVRLEKGALLLLNGDPLSFDGRYFGPSAAGDIVGRARPLFVRSAR